jgi:nucleoside-diphosphate-sugar epimerase
MGMKALIFGATGMVGSEVLHLCLENEKFERVVTVGRRLTGISHSKLEEIEHDNFLDFSSLKETFSEVDVCFYCLGVYQAKVNKEKFWEITVDYLNALLDTMERVEKEITFCLFSAQGADPSEKSPIRFAKAKGRADKRLIDSSLKSKYIFRPGFIAPGRRGPKPMISSIIFKQIYKLLPFIGIDAPDLAKVMLHVALNGNENIIFENGQMRTISKTLS